MDFIQSWDNLVRQAIEGQVKGVSVYIKLADDDEREICEINQMKREFKDLDGNWIHADKVESVSHLE